MGMSCDERDKAIHECMTFIWKAYRSGAQSFNACFADLHLKYGQDPTVETFINYMGFALAPAVARRTHENLNQQ